MKNVLHSRGLEEASLFVRNDLLLLCIFQTSYSDSDSDDSSDILVAIRKMRKMNKEASGTYFNFS